MRKPPQSINIHLLKSATRWQYGADFLQPRRLKPNSKCLQLLCSANCRVLRLFHILCHREFLEAVVTENIVFWYVTRCGLVKST